MKKQEIYDLFKNIITNGTVLIDEPMKNHTSFKIGGPVDILVMPGSLEEVSSSIKACKENDIEYMVMGNGSNLLITDKGIRGVIIKIAENLNEVKVEDNKIIAQSGALLSVVSKMALKHSLGGLEFASGIPGSLGGAVAMNAGAYGGEMKDVISKVKCIDLDGNIVEFTNSEMNFGYRQSIVQKERLIVVEGEITLKEEDYDKINEYMKELNKKRTTKQPLHLPSAGSTFKRPEGYFAGKLIEDSGLRGLRHGDAQVSDQHCGFIVNLGNATSSDVINLIRTVQKTVKDKFGVQLETEVKIIGEQ
ncbi:UDP-N-acetylenolpyruvoylglucosamine reductase MurB [Gottschalkia purinilytica]|uniref:UDP-N-acetylenolpyruvoylglucosamine reductase n=1 Tax=Gottschalkia purinilytica TaxID=1503 RepID=A0A0L0WCF4_GOTPU|nr:UDP-N-acetylmuramate dehydrogenase [Gottschalkia purinilytica]KNF09148.1 UDP-N-acetylenolpyruvoylglucosamine reductase MurB [Gottschalkia purinilytica]